MSGIFVGRCRWRQVGARRSGQIVWPRCWRYLAHRCCCLRLPTVEVGVGDSRIKYPVINYYLERLENHYYVLGDGKHHFGEHRCRQRRLAVDKRR